MKQSSVLIEKISKKALFKKINEICASVNESILPKVLLEKSLRQTMELFGANRGSIFILKEGGEDLILKISQGIKRADKAKLVKRMGEGIVGMVAELKKPVIVEDIDHFLH